MKTLAAVVLALATGAGCYATGYGSTGFSTVGVGVTPGYVAYSTPPPEVVDVDVYADDRPGYVYVNGRYNWSGNQWMWQDGTWEAERPDQVFIQGYWNGNQYVNGYWTGQRAGYVHTGGYWEPRGTGHVWVQGTWEPQRNDSVYVRGRWDTSGGQRTYNRGTWSPRGAGRSGPVVRDHRR